MIDSTCNAVTVDNIDLDCAYDLLLIECHEGQITLRNSLKDLIMSCALLPPKSLDVTLKHWFYGSSAQHLLVKTINKISAFLPESISELR